jgi:hypothetical protein
MLHSGFDKVGKTVKNFSSSDLLHKKIMPIAVGMAEKYAKKKLGLGQASRTGGSKKKVVKNMSSLFQ